MFNMFDPDAVTGDSMSIISELSSDSDFDVSSYLEAVVEEDYGLDDKGCQSQFAVGSRNSLECRVNTLSFSSVGAHYNDNICYPQVPITPFKDITSSNKLPVVGMDFVTSKLKTQVNESGIETQAKKTQRKNSSKVELEANVCPLSKKALKKARQRRERRRKPLKENCGLLKAIEESASSSKIKSHQTRKNSQENQSERKKNIEEVKSSSLDKRSQSLSQSSEPEKSQGPAKKKLRRKKKKGRNGNMYIGVANRLDWLELQKLFGFNSVNNFGTFMLKFMKDAHRDISLLTRLAVLSGLHAHEGLVGYIWINGLPVPINAEGRELNILPVTLTTDEESQLVGLVRILHQSSSENNYLDEFEADTEGKPHESDLVSEYMEMDIHHGN